MDCVECDIILWLRGLSVGRFEVDAGSLAGGARSSGKGFHHSKPNARSQRKLSSHDMSIERRAYTILLSAVQLYSQVTRVGVQVRNETSLAARVHACLHLRSNTDTHDFCQHTADQHGLAQPISHPPHTRDSPHRSTSHVSHRHEHAHQLRSTLQPALNSQSTVLSHFGAAAMTAETFHTTPLLSRVRVSLVFPPDLLASGIFFSHRFGSLESIA